MTYVDRGYLEIDGTEVECSSIDVDTDASVDSVEVMRREARAKGFMDGIPKFSISAEIPMEDSDPVNLEALLLNKTLFTTVIEYEGGLVKSYNPCRMSSVKASTKSGDVTNYSVEIIALDKA